MNFFFPFIFHLFLISYSFHHSLNHSQCFHYSINYQKRSFHQLFQEVLLESHLILIMISNQLSTILNYTRTISKIGIFYSFSQILILIFFFSTRNRTGDIDSIISLYTQYGQLTRQLNDLKNEKHVQSKADPKDPVYIFSLWKIMIIIGCHPTRS